MMRTEWTSLSETERGAFTVLMAFLRGRLASAETVNWALQIGPDERVKRAAVLQVLDSPDGSKLTEPWRTAWRLIEEYWDAPHLGYLADTKPYDVRERVRSGDRSGSLVRAIAEVVAPRLRVSAPSRSRSMTGKPFKKPRVVTQLLSTGLTSGKAVDPHALGLQDVDDDAFLSSLANALEYELNRGLDIARRLGWDGERRLYRLGQLHRAYFVPADERNAGEHEPDEFHEGIVPCVKLLHFVVERLAKRHVPAAISIVGRWKLTASPIHLRLWAALSRDPWVTSANDVADVLERLGDRPFWDVQNFPEIAELRAVRFKEFDKGMQQTLGTRLRKLPPRNQWPRATDTAHLGRARLYWALRELRRIEVAGGVLSARDKAWMTSEIANFPELAQMTRLDDGFMGTPKATWVPPNPDERYESLAGDERLLALEVALSSERRGWDDDASGRAWDWLRQAGNATKLIADLEASADAGTAFPEVWERFGWAHVPPAEVDGATSQVELNAQASRILALLGRLREDTIRHAIDGISQWMSTWRSYAVRLPEELAVWQRLWPIAVEVTDAAQRADEDIDLNLVARGSDEREPMDLDTLDTPAGKLVEVFLAACPSVKGQHNPFAADPVARTMRDLAIATVGRSGLIVRHRLIEHLAFFLRADSEWAQLHLIGALRENTADLLSLWRALARRSQFGDVVKIIGDDMIIRTTDLRLGRETRSSLVFSLVVECLHSLNEHRPPAVSYGRIQQMIRALDDEVRAHAAGAIPQFVREMSAEHESQKVVRTPEDLFQRAAVPFLHDVWPQERSLSTPAVSKALAVLPAIARGAFVSAVDVIQRFLVPFDTWSMLDYGLFGHEDDEPKLVSIDDSEKAKAFLRLLNLTIGTAPSAIIPYDLGSALAQIEKIAPTLAQDPIFRRLSTAARR